MEQRSYPSPGGGAQGGQLGQIEYLSQTNENVDFLDLSEKFKFIDDLSILEDINLAMCGITSYNFKQHIPSDIGTHGQYLPVENVDSQTHLNKIAKWTRDNLMTLNTNKTKYMVINFARNFQFNTRINLENELLEEVQECKLLGLTITNKLSWSKNTENLVKKANTRMLILHKL